MKKFLSWFLIVFAVLALLPTVSVISSNFPEKTSSDTLKNKTGSLIKNKKTSSFVSSKNTSERSSLQKKKGKETKKTTSQAETNKAGDIEYRVLNHKTGKVETMSAEKYITGVVSAEMPATFHPEALKAQAVAANTYAIRIMAQNKADSDKTLKGAYFSTDPNKFQAYNSSDDMKKAYGKNYNAYYKKIKSAVKSVIDEMIVYKNEPIVAAFHSISAGKTENSKTLWGSETSYLKSVNSKTDTSANGYLEKVSIKSKKVKNLIAKEYKKAKFLKNKAKWFGKLKRSKAGTVTKIFAFKTTLNGTDVRRIFNLRSANFSVVYNKKNNSFIFTTKGYGHGIGMSQYGANELANKGKTYKQILLHYYTGVNVIKIK